MAKTAMTRARVEPELKPEAEKVLTTLGQTALHNGLPFELRIPTDETLAAVRQVRSGKTSAPLPAWRKCARTC